MAEFLKNPPSVSTRPDFTKVRALRKHIIKALKQLECPQSQVHGWSGLVMDPALYILLKANVFVIPVSPGPTAIYPQLATPAQMKMINNVYARNKNYYLPLMNINRACFCMLNKTVPDQYKSQTTQILLGVMRQCPSAPSLTNLWQTTACQTGWYSSTTIRCSEVRSLQRKHPKCSFIAQSSAKKSR